MMDVSFDCQDVRSFPGACVFHSLEADGGHFPQHFSATAPTRVNGIMGGFEAAAVFHGALAGAPALASFAAIVLAYFFYRKNAMLAFYLAFPLMALASLLPASLDPFGGGTTFLRSACGGGACQVPGVVPACRLLFQRRVGGVVVLGPYALRAMDGKLLGPSCGGCASYAGVRLHCRFAVAYGCAADHHGIARVV